MTMSKIIGCKYECGTQLGEFDSDAHKYKEVDTGEIHTYERCQAAKAKLATQTEKSKENEQKLKETTKILIPAEYVDHTASRPSKCKIFFSNYAPDVEKEYEEFQKGKSFAWARAQSHVTRDYEDIMLFTIFLYYEEKQ